MNRKEFLKYLEEININLTEEMEEKLNQYADFLLEYNEHTNLTAIKTKEEVYLKHFYDSLTITKLADFSNQSLLDVGSGAGFPGLVLAIVYPNLKVTLLDSNNKKTNFLKTIIELLKIQNVEVIHARAEEYVRNNREKFDFVTSRAVAELRILLELNIPAVKVNGLFLGMKAKIEDELKDSTRAIEKLDCVVKEKIEFELPKEAGFRTLISIKKEKVTNPIYPRTYDKIKKKSP